MARTRGRVMVLILVAIGVGLFLLLVGWDVDRKEARHNALRGHVLEPGRRRRRRFWR